MKKGVFLQYFVLALSFVGGWLGFAHINQVSTQASGSFIWVLGIILVTIAALAIGLYFNIVLHEVGHLLGGLLTGYGFVLFFVLRTAIMKEDGKLVLRKYGIPGTGGGVTLSPPDMREGTYPFKLYISGGFLVNFLTGAACLGLFAHFAGTADLWARAFLVVGIVAVALGLVNLIPVNDVLPNDGYILFNLGKRKNDLLRRGMWSASRIQALGAKGMRPRDIPTELFDWVDVDNINDMFSFGTALYRYCYLLDKQELSEARTFMQALSANFPDSFPDRLKMMCYTELLFHELVAERRQDEIERLYTKELSDYLKSTTSDVDTQRTMYAYARLALNDSAKAKKHLDLFHAACAIPLNAGRAPGEKKLIALVDEIADGSEG